MTLSRILTDSYRRSGDIRPRQPELGSIVRFALSENAPRDPGLWLAAAHASIDLAMLKTDSARAALISHQKVGRFLDKITEKADLLLEAGDVSAFKIIAPLAVTATLQKSELPRWRSVWKGNPPVKNYEELLEASLKAIQYTKSGSDEARSKLVAFMPVLLGARGRHSSHTEGWVGRLSLLREEQRYGVEATQSYNANWNVGVCVPGLDHTFQDPFRIRVSRKSGCYDGPSRMAGVAAISSNDCFLSDPERIILSCLNEFEPTKTPDDMKLFQGDQLDAITALTLNQVHGEVQRVAQ